jgi:hypothetical protein
LLEQMDGAGLGEFRRQLATTGEASGGGIGEQREARPPVKCYRCGVTGHVSKYCSVAKDKNTLICYKCHGIGHTQFDCKAANNQATGPRIPTGAEIVHASN